VKAEEVGAEQPAQDLGRVRVRVRLTLALALALALTLTLTLTLTSMRKGSMRKISLLGQGVCRNQPMRRRGSFSLRMGGDIGRCREM